jgi:Tfp pilus assembly protein PilV
MNPKCQNTFSVQRSAFSVMDTPICCDTARRKSGFTLIEALVACVLVVIGIAGALSAISASLHAEGAAKFYQSAGPLAQAKLAEIENDPNTEAGTDEGDFGDKYPGFAWSSKITTITDTDDGPKGLWEASVTVYEVNDRRNPRQVTLSTYLLRQGKE